MAFEVADPGDLAGGIFLELPRVFQCVGVAYKIALAVVLNSGLMRQPD